MSAKRTYTLLALGDSYTIGESVEEKQRFPVQAMAMLKKDGLVFEQPVIIAKTGWTTDELADAIKAENLNRKFDFVTLLVGVNNQYRQRDPEEYRQQFRRLLQQAIGYASGKNTHVVVLSIPDWGVTPFIANDGKKRTTEQVAKEIDQFNAINREEAVRAKVNYIDITSISRRAAAEPELTAADGLHPSGKMYKEWAQLLASAIKKLTVS